VSWVGQITRAEILEQHLGRTEEAVTANIERVLGRRLPDGFVEARRAAYTREFTSRLTPVRGVRRAVERLQQLGHDTCVASSGSYERLNLTLGLTGLGDLFEGRIYSADDVPRGKPAPDLFLLAAERMRYDPGACLVIEDSPSGVQAASAAGMRVIGYAGLIPERALSEADEVIDDMAHLVSAVERIGRPV
jgi:haloacid dehalogenase superfamily, subfamily IA, variant 3 with third motif having DD or ED